MRKVPIQIRVDAHDLGEWQKRASGEGKSLSEWMRERCNQDREDMPRLPEVRVGRRSVVSRLPVAGGAEAAAECVPVEEHPKVASCKHGRPRGFNCWQCGGLAKVTG